MRNHFLRAGAGGSAGGGGGWGVPDLPGLYAWYDPSEANTLTMGSTNNSHVVNILDKSGNNNHAGLDPELFADGPLINETINGLPALGSPGYTGSTLTAQGYGLAGPQDAVNLDAITVITVYNQRAVPSQDPSRYRICGIGKHESNGQRKTFGLALDNTLRFDGSFNSGTISPSTGIKFRISYGSAASGRVTDIINGQINISNQLHASGWASKEDTILLLQAIIHPTGSNERPDALLGETIFLSEVISQADIDNVTDYYNAKWGTSG